MRRALILAGGGVAGIAWELGVLSGLQDAAPELWPALAEADLVVGTSAGSTVAAQITSGVPLSDLYAAHLADTTSELEVDVDFEQFVARMTAAAAGADTAAEVRRRIAAIALDTDTVDEATRLAVIAARLPVPDWPAADVRLPAVDAATGELVVFTAASGVRLVDAVAASCAVPGVWPPVTIDGRRYVDGGVRSGTNADLAAGYDRVLIITPTPADAPSPFGSLDDEITALAPAQVVVIHADAASLDAFGTNPLSPATRAPSAAAGRQVGATQGRAVRGLWSGA